MAFDAVAKMRDAKLEALLTRWAREYGLGPADRLGYASENALARLERHAGWLPPPEPVRAPVRTEADKVEMLVQAMERTDKWKHGRILRIDYYRPNDSMDSRLARLKRIGVVVSKAGYEQYLEEAKLHIWEHFNRA